MGTHNHLCLQFQGIQGPPLASLSTRHVQKQNTHTHKKQENELKKKCKERNCVWNGTYKHGTECVVRNQRVEEKVKADVNDAELLFE